MTYRSYSEPVKFLIPSNYHQSFNIRLDFPAAYIAEMDLFLFLIVPSLYG